MRQLALLLCLSLFVVAGCSRQPAETTYQTNPRNTRYFLASSTNVTLAWNPAPMAIGYKVYFGCASGNYTNITSVGLVTNVTIPGLSRGVWYYFACTSLGSNTESGFSDEVAYLIPGGVVDTNIYTTNIIYSRVWQLSVQTDVVYYAVGPVWTNGSVPGYPNDWFVRMNLLSNNLWQAQQSAYTTGPWSNMPWTVKSSRIPRLGTTNILTFPVSTNVTTNDTVSLAYSAAPPVPWKR